MSDKELLEKAAKAAGYELAWGGPDGDMARRKDTWDNWNPLFSDCDALRLSVVLRINIAHVKNQGGDYVLIHAHPIGLGHLDALEPVGTDPLAATRLAIVRAAAALAGESQG